MLNLNQKNKKKNYFIIIINNYFKNIIKIKKKLKYSL